MDDGASSFWNIKLSNSKLHHIDSNLTYEDIDVSNIIVGSSPQLSIQKNTTITLDTTNSLKEIVVELHHSANDNDISNITISNNSLTSFDVPSTAESIFFKTNDPNEDAIYKKEISLVDNNCCLRCRR